MRTVLRAMVKMQEKISSILLRDKTKLERILQGKSVYKTCSSVGWILRNIHLYHTVAYTAKGLPGSEGRVGFLLLVLES